MRQIPLDLLDASPANPLRGCSRVSEGCRNCYAEKMAARFSGPGQPYGNVIRVGMANTLWNGRVELVEKHLLDPLKWRKPKKIFVDSMSDLFHDSVPDGWIDSIFAVMALCPQHTFQVLTKRPERMLQYLTSGPTNCNERRCPRENHVLNTADFLTRAGKPWEKHRGETIFLEARIQRGEWKWPLPNVWLGVSVENQAAADGRGAQIGEAYAGLQLGPENLTNRVGKKAAGAILDGMEHKAFPLGNPVFTGLDMASKVEVATGRTA